LCDIGAGAGFPSVPLAIVRQDLQVTALDSTAKKMTFVSDAVSKLHISNLQTLVGRAEEQFELFETFDVVTARAVSSLPILLELCLPLVKVGGIFIAYKTDLSELDTAKSALTALHATLFDKLQLTLPNGDNRAILVFKKLKSTPEPYPRSFGAIKKKPL
ncbi:MAG: 16S rRNA (guanine(527)-N(7))-methyltransferase RsmG, partial [Clostridia bacterium]